MIYPSDTVTLWIPACNGVNVAIEFSTRYGVFQRRLETDPWKSGQRAFRLHPTGQIQISLTESFVQCRQ